MTYETALGAALLICSLAGAALLSRWAVTEGRTEGRHRRIPSLPMTDVAPCGCTAGRQMTDHTVLPSNRLACRSCGLVKEPT